MSSTFGSDPPIYAKPVRSAASSSTTESILNRSPVFTVRKQQLLMHPTPEDDMQRPAIEKEIAELYFAVEKARKAAAEEACVEKEAKQLKMQHDEQLSSLRAMALVQLNSG
jgi:hypothetical protein